jgi:hypothetical protein
MKLLIVLIIFIPNIILAQSTDALYDDNQTNSRNELSNLNSFVFNNEERTIKWVKIFNVDSSFTFGQIIENLANNNLFSNAKIDEDVFEGKLNPKKIDFIKYGYKTMSAPIIFRSKHQSDVKIEFKQGKYRVSVENIEYVEDGSVDILMRGIISPLLPSSKGDIEPYNGDFSFKTDGTIRTRNKIIFEILDKFFCDIFQYKKKDLNKDW